MNIQLSISLLASDRPSALERCLDSLTPLLLRVPSELIIVHTGTDSKVSELAHRYTDLVLPFTWCNDFSAARNTGIKAAKGEWFLYIDDDEWFEDVSEIYEFFESGESRKYGMACYRQRNYPDWSGTCYTDSQVMRMVRMVPGIHFQNPIHEEPTPLSPPCKYFDTFVHHYGYVRFSGYSKTSRNLMLLKEDVKKRPAYIKNYIQLVQEYAIEENWKEAENNCRKGLELCKSRITAAGSYWDWLQAELIELLYMSGNYPGAEKTACTILQNDSPRELAAADIYATLILVASKGRDSEKILHFGLKFEEILSYIEQTPKIWTEQNYGSLSVEKISNPKRLCRLRMLCLKAALDQEDQKNATFFFSHLPWDSKDLIESLYSDFERLDSNFHTQYAVLLKTGSSSVSYQSFYNVIHGTSNSKERERLLIKYIAESKSDDLRKQALKEMILSGTELNETVNLLDLDTWRQYLADTVKNLSDMEAQKAWRASNGLNEDYLLYQLVLKKELLGRSLHHGYYTGEKLMKTLSEYAETILSFYKMQYRDEMFRQENQNFLPRSCRFACLLSEAIQKIEHMEYEKAVHLLHSALLLNLEMTGVISEVVREISGKIKNPMLNTSAEFQMLAKQMKAALKTMLINKQYQDAQPIVTQLLQLLPEDLELLRIKQKIGRELCNESSDRVSATLISNKTKGQ